MAESTPITARDYSNNPVTNMLKAYLEGSKQGAQGVTELQRTKLLAQMANQRQGLAKEAQAIQQAQSVYNKGLPNIQKTVSAASELLDLINDPNNPGSVGQAKTLILKSLGMNRYNEKEANAVLPPAFRNSVSTLFNYAGGDNNPLNSSQRAMINQFGNMSLQSSENQHNILKQNSLNSAMSSPFANEMTASRLSGLGSPMDAQFAEYKNKYKNLPQTQGPNLTSEPNPSPLQNFFSYLSNKTSSMLNPTSQQASQNNQPNPLDVKIQYNQQQLDDIKKAMAKKVKPAMDKQAQKEAQAVQQAQSSDNEE